MMKKTVLTTLFFVFYISVFAQIEKYPVFKNCDTLDIAVLEQCFKHELKNKVMSAFEIPEIVSKDKFEGIINIVFLVDVTGDFKVLYVNSPYKELKDEAHRVFNALSNITPAKYNNHPIEMRFVFPLHIPLNKNVEQNIIQEQKSIPQDNFTFESKKQSKITKFPEHNSQLNIPLTYFDYNNYAQLLNKPGNNHTASKPFVYAEYEPLLDLETRKNNLLLNKTTWFGRKLFNEHMAYVQGENFWFTINPMVDLQLGTDSEDVETFNNTRAIQVNGGLGKKLSFSTSFYESQGRFANYINQYAKSIKPAGGNPAIIPGRGIAKEFKTDAYDYPVAEAYLSYTPNKNFNFQFGNGKNFIGDGYRSLFLSDVASPYPYFKINTTFWKIKYTNLWLWLQDVRPELTVDGAYKQKYMALHYLSWNVTNKFNIGLFESVIWDNANNRGFDVKYLNPLIFYTAIEFSSGSRAGNSLLGLSFKYKLKNISLYSQILVDEFRISEITKSNGWWGNKIGYQFGLKYFNAFNVDNLILQAEVNAVRPYTYSHDELNYNYGHNNQPMAHLWGSNFKEFVAIAQYTKNRWFTFAKIVAGKKGFDFNTAEDNLSYGGDIFKDNDNRVSEYNNSIAQGNKANILIADFQVGYTLNPATNLKLFGGFTYRDFNPTAPTGVFDKSNSTWISVGLKTDMFNWYFDF
jgi:hypothetical protein